MKKKNFQKNPRQIVQGLTAAAMLFIAAQGEAQGQTLGDIVPTRIAGGNITRNSNATGILSLDVGQVKATNFVGNGGQITGLNASQFTTGTLGSGVIINSSNDITTAKKVQGSHLFSTGVIEANGALTANNIFVQAPKVGTALPVKGTVWAGRVDADSFTIKGNALTATLNPKEAITISNNSNRNLPAINPRNSINIIGHKSGTTADDVASYGIFVNGIGSAPGDSRIQHKWNAEPDKNGVTVLTKGNEDASMIDWKSNAATDTDNWLEFKHFNGASKGLGTTVTWNTHFALSQAGDATVSGNVSAKKFYGDGSNLKNLPMPVGIVSIQEVGQVRKLSFLDDVVDFGKDVFFKGANVSITGNVNLGASSDVVSPLRVKGNEFSELRLRAVNEAYTQDPVHSAVIQSHHNNNDPYISFGINDDDVKMTMSRTNATLNTPLVISNQTDKVNLICGTGSFDTQNPVVAIHGIVHTETKHPLILGANNFKRILIDPAGPTSIITEKDGKFPTLSQSTKSLFGLTVTKGVLSEDVAISSKINWADYVFEKDYKLTSLEELEAFIKNNKHLPEITSESKIKEVGFYQVHDVLVGQLKNLEEQVLHNISQEKKLKLQQDQLIEQATKIANQQAQLDKLEAILNQFMNK